MKKISNWENVKENSGFEKLPVGGYVCAIKNVTDHADKEYLWIEFDIVKGENKGWFKKQYDNDTRNPKKWSGNLIRSYKDSAASMFKGFTTAVEKSNKNYKWDWDETTLKNKYLGIVFGEEEYLNSKGQLRTRVVPVQVHSVEAIENNDFKIPELKKLDPSKVSNAATSAPVDFVDPFAATTESALEEEVPFDVEENPFA